MIAVSILIAIAYLLGVTYDALNKVARVRKKHPKLTFKETWATFFSEEWNTLMVSGAGWITVQFAWYIIHINNVKLPFWIEQWGIYPIALLLGYALQRLVYKFLGTFEKVLEEKANRIGTVDRRVNMPQPDGGPGGSSNPPGDTLPPPPPGGNGG